MYDFFHSNEASRVESNSMRCMVITHNGSAEKHPGRAWDVSTWKEHWKLFYESDTAKQCQLVNPNMKLLSPTTFYRKSCKCLTNPKVESCVDIIKSSQFHYQGAMHKHLQKRTDTKEVLSNCTCPLHIRPKEKQWVRYLSLPAEKMVYLACCDR